MISYKIKTLLFISFFIGSFTLFAGGSKVSTSFTVHGQCEMCKSRIEKAAYIKGVKKAVWEKDSKTLSVLFRDDKTSLEAIKASILKIGYDVESTVAPMNNKNKLPYCCQRK